MKTRLTSLEHQPRPIRCIETGVVYEGIKSAADAMGLDRSYIRQSIRKTSRKVQNRMAWHFEYVE